MGKVLQLTSVGLNASQNILEISPPFPGVTFSIEPPIILWKDLPSIKKAFNRWLLINGLNELIEAVGWSLEEVRKICAFISLSEGGIISKDIDVNNEIFGPLKKFHKFGLPNKLDYLSDKYGVNIIPESSECLRSIKKARNCVVHRNGIVSDLDTNSGDVLIVKWKTLTIFRTQPDGKEVVLGNEPRTLKNGTVSVRPVESKKIFKKGEEITFTNQEFVHIYHTLRLCMMDIISEVKKYANSKGVPERNSRKQQSND